HQLLQATVLVLEVLQALGLADVHPAELRLPAVEGLLRHPKPPADLLRRGPSVDFLQRADDLLFGKSALASHTSSIGGLTLQLVQFSGGTSPADLHDAVRHFGGVATSGLKYRR